MNLHENAQIYISAILGIISLVFVLVSSTMINMTGNYYDAFYCSIEDEIFISVNFSLYVINNLTSYYIGRPGIYENGYCYTFQRINQISFTKPTTLQYQIIFISFLVWSLILLSLSVSYAVYLKLRMTRYEPI